MAMPFSRGSSWPRDWTCISCLLHCRQILYPLGHLWSPFFLVQFSHSVVFNSLWPHGLQHARPPCPSPTPGACSNSCPSSQWCHPTISSSVIPISCLHCFSASGSIPVIQLFASSGQSIRVSASASVLPMNKWTISFRIDKSIIISI